jgi:hypothetical protein
MNREELREACHDAIWLCIAAPGIDFMIEEIFEIVTRVIMQRFGLRLIDTELLLRDARNEADDLLDKYDVDNLADVDEVIEAISKHLAEIAAPRRSTPA